MIIVNDAREDKIASKANNDKMRILKQIVAHSNLKLVNISPNQLSQ